MNSGNLKAMAVEDRDFDQETEFLNESISSFHDTLPPSEFSFILALLGWLIVGSTLNLIIFGSFPLKLATSEWQLSLIGALLSSSLALLIGTAMVVFARLLNIEDRTLQNWQLLAGRFAALLAVLLVLIIPFQFFLGSRLLKKQTSVSVDAVSNLQGIIKGISAVNSEAQLRAYVGSLPNPPSLPAKFDAPFPVIKARAIENIKAQINAINNSSELQKTEAFQIFLKEAIRNTAQAILMAAAFSLLASASGKSTNKIIRFFNAIV
jgi:hypothetical protein